MRVGRPARTARHAVKQGTVSVAGGANCLAPQRGRHSSGTPSRRGVITAQEITTLLEGGWRERRTAAWLVAVSRRTEFRERLGELLLASEVCCAGLAYCVTQISLAVSAWRR